MQFDLGLVESEAEASDGRVTGLGESPTPVPHFVVYLPSWPETFLSNLKDSLWTAEPPRLRLASKPGEFWPDVFVASGPAWGRFSQSVVLHALAIAAIWATVMLWPRRSALAEPAAFHHEDVIYYSASDYLPPLDTGAARAQLPRKGDPAPAPQPIISVPPESDNRTQTIVAPPNVQWNHDVPMPNVVAWAQRTVPVPLAATSRALADPRATALNLQPVAPAPETAVTSARRLPQAPQAAVVEPAPTLDASIRRTGDLSIGRSAVVAPAPQLPLAAQRSTTIRPTLGNASPGVVPPSPPLQNAGLSSSGQRMIALGIHPIAATGPIDPPAGNRRGTFAATPQGKAGAPGSPDIAAHAGGHGAGDGKGTGDAKDIPPGLHVGSGPQSASHSAVAGGGQGQVSGGSGSNSSAANNPFLMAKLQPPPRVSALPPRMSPESPAESEEEKQVFGDRKFYAMTLNMPNLNSGGGSWVIHFAELNESADKSDLSAPSPIAIADPAYPLELMKQNVRGTVILYAVIHNDGSVSDIRVLSSADDRLDQYAHDAFARWRFRPATKNGSAVDLAAVVTIPFKPGRMRAEY